MSFPSGAPGGFPGQGPHQPQQPHPGPAPSGAGPKIALPQLLFLVTAGLGALNLFLGFASIGTGASFYESAWAWVPALLLISGATAAFNLLPGGDRPGAWPAAFAAGAVLPFLFGVFQSEGSLAAGGVLVLIFGILQLLAAVAAYLFEAGVLKPPSPPQAAGPYGHGPYAQQLGGFGQQQFGQQPPPDSGGMAQPTKFAQPVQPGQPGQQPTQQPTQYAPQHGQFFQPSAESGQQGGPGTPPGGNQTGS